EGPRRCVEAAAVRQDSVEIEDAGVYLRAEPQLAQLERMVDEPGWREAECPGEPREELRCLAALDTERAPAAGQFLRPHDPRDRRQRALVGVERVLPAVRRRLEVRRLSGV